jgi:outer membrane murein-binding lipoprotein Lpp
VISTNNKIMIMKYFATLLLMAALSSCGPNSSPEKRMSSKIDSLQKQVDDLSSQQKELKDSIAALSRDLRNR